MGRSHAKNNTTQSTLTYYERSLLRKDSQAQRLGQDSFRELDACHLCLSKLTNPVSCSQGHVYCTECVLSDLISQKAGIESQKRESERWDENERLEREVAVQNARERVVKDFEKGMGLGLGAGTGRRSEINESNEKKEEMNGRSKFELDSTTLDKVAKEAEEKALRTIEKEQAESRKAKLPAFWLPSLAPEGKVGPISYKDVKLQTLCQFGGTPHPLSRKTLLPVILTYPPSTTITSSSSSSSKPICPSCSKELSNSTSSILLSSRSPLLPQSEDANGDHDDGRKKKKQKKDKEAPLVCGHVICQTCSDTIVKPQGRCCVCEAKVEDEGRIPLGKEGTGFAAAGGAEVKKATTAFRV